MSGKVFNEKCVVTGEPARYRDPVTGQPYATLAAFKILRERFVEQVGCAARGGVCPVRGPPLRPSLCPSALTLCVFGAGRRCPDARGASCKGR